MLTGWTAFWFMLGFIVFFMTLYFLAIRFVIKVLGSKGDKNIADIYSSRFTIEQIGQFERME